MGCELKTLVPIGKVIGVPKKEYCRGYGHCTSTIIGPSLLGFVVPVSQIPAVLGSQSPEVGTPVGCPD